MSGATGLQPGAIFAGDFEIVRPLSAGGMGAVYVARQLSTGRERALKVMLGELLQNEDLRKRFAQEARIGASIESDHIVEVVGAGIDAATGSPWLAMELLQGEDFAHRLARERALAPEAVLALFEQLVHAIGAAHRQGIVHRDLKPENLFLAHSRRSGQQSVVKVLDFGIAKLLGQARTKATGAMGTPLWMAPEQTQAGKGVTPAADVWALGLIAFRALTGHSFWKAAADSDSSPMMVLREVVMDPIPLASARARELGGAALPVGFDAWFARCAAREPTDRFPDANAMFDALRRVLTGAGATAYAPMAGSQPMDALPAPQPMHTPQPTHTPPAMFAAAATPPSFAPAAATAAPHVRTLVASPPVAKGAPWALIGGGVSATAIAAVAAVLLMRSPSEPKTKPSRRDESSEPRVTKQAPTASAIVATPAPRAEREPLPPPSSWPTDIEAAMTVARAEHRRVLIHFQAEWCAACQELKRRTFADDQLRRKARDLLPVRVDLTDDEAPGGAELRRKYGVTGLPLVLLLDENGDELVRLEEFVEPEDMLAKLQNPGPPHPVPSIAPPAGAAPPPSPPRYEPKPEAVAPKRPAQKDPPKFTPDSL